MTLTSKATPPTKLLTQDLEREHKKVASARHSMHPDLQQACLTGSGEIIPNVYTRT